jgi:hypothetical protein
VTLSTKEDTNNRFDRIENMLSGAHGMQIEHRTTEMITLTGKRKEQTQDHEHGDEEDFAYSQQIM